jgi:hypothetical protein
MRGRLPLRWLVAAAVGALGAWLVYLAIGQLSVVLLAGPLAYIVGDAAAAVRKARLQAIIDAAFVELVSDDAADPNFNGRGARILRQRSRLVGLPPRLLDLRLVAMPDGTHYAVRAETARADPDAIAWRVARLTDAERERVLG